MKTKKTVKKPASKTVKCPYPIPKDDEARACAAFFGTSNLALVAESELRKIIRDNINDFSRMESTFCYLLGRMAESDDMYEGFLDEVKSWRTKKQLSSPYVRETWAKELASARA